MAPLKPGGRRPTIYCSPACRQRAYRARKAEVYEGIGPPRSTAHPDEQVAAAVLEAICVAGEFRRLGRDASPYLAWRCEKVGRELHDAIAEHFPAALSAAGADLERARDCLRALL